MTRPTRSAGESGLLDKLREEVYLDPAAAARRLLALAEPESRQWTALTADMLCLRVEALVRVGELVQAQLACIDAAAAAGGLSPRDAGRVIAVSALAADVAIRTGRMCEALDSARLYRTTFNFEVGQSLERTVLAGAVDAVARYHHVSCHDGRGSVSELMDTVVPGSPIALTLRAGLHAMQQRCQTGRSLPVRNPPAPIPGLVLTPDFATSAYLRDLVGTHAPACTCLIRGPAGLLTGRSA